MKIHLYDISLYVLIYDLAHVKLHGSNCLCKSNNSFNYERRVIIVYKLNCLHIVYHFYVMHIIRHILIVYFCRVSVLIQHINHYYKG